MIGKVAEPLKDALVGLGRAFGIHVVTRTQVSEVRELIRSLHPIDTGTELIRLGPDGDGGYLLPNDLDGIEYAFSPGVSTESGFDADLAEQGVRVYLADFSVDGPGEAHPNFTFDKKHVGSLSSDTVMTLDDWKDSKIPGYEGDLVLQMDIEGSEFEALLSASSKLLSQFRIIVIEFHNLDQLLNRPFFHLASKSFQKLLKTHSVVHIHPNNAGGSVKIKDLEIPRVAEFTFYRNDRFSDYTYRRTYPDPLDRNNAAKPSLILPECWHR